MDEVIERKYFRLLELLPVIGELTYGHLALVGGTALAVFYLDHRGSIDIDLVPLHGQDEAKEKERLKGELSKKGYQTQRAVHINQFVVQFENTAIKIEVFTPELKIQQIQEREVSEKKIMVASLDDLFEMKLLAYQERKYARDLYDLFCILKKTSKLDKLNDIIQRYGLPSDPSEVAGLVFKERDYLEFVKVITHVA